MGHIPRESLRAWKLILLSLNEGFDKKSVNILLALRSTGNIVVSGEGLLQCAALISSNYLEIQRLQHYQPGSIAAYAREERYLIRLTKPGKMFVEAWEQGDQRAAVISNLGNTIT